MDPVMQFAAVVTITLAVLLFSRGIHLPGIVGLLVTGMLIGPGGADLLPREPVVDLLGSVGLVYLMFLAGLEVDLDILRDHRTETAAFGALSFGLSVVPGTAAGLLLGLGPAAAVLLGTLLSSHTLVGYPIVERLGLLHREPIVVAIGGTLITDTLALTLLAIVIALAAGTGNGGAVEAVAPLAGLAALATLSLWVVPRLSRLILDRAGATTAEKALYVLVIVLVLAVAADLLGTEKILGAFLAGLCLNRILQRREVLREHVEFAGHMLFIPFFFVSTGMLLELEVFHGRMETWLVAALLVGIVLFGKGTAAWITGRVYGYSTRERIAVVGLTVPQAAATLAVTMIAREAGLFPELVVDAVIILILATCLGGILVTQGAGKALSEVPGREAPRLPR